MMIEGSHPPAPDPSSRSQNDILAQAPTGLGRSYAVKGDTAIREWAHHFYPGMSKEQTDRFVKQFLQTICQEIGRQISKEMARARKRLRKMREAEEGRD
ncbi:MAG: hypothetical protein OXF02_03930 [Simkaniaceae bacterium]|nr:hypothetical protein [Simkaniaceae bacterium]